MASKKKIDFKNYKFRCSALGYLMTKSRGSDPLSATTKSYLKAIYIKEKYGRDKDYDTKNKFTDKGTIVESDALDLLAKVSKEKYFKNQILLQNDYIMGTPDVVKPLIDIKCSWDMWTFGSVDEAYAKATHQYQILGYGWLTNQVKGEIVYALVDTPDHLIENELYRISFKLPSDFDVGVYRKNFKFGDVPAKEKIKRYSLDVDELDIEILKAKIIDCREYLNKLSL